MGPRRRPGLALTDDGLQQHAGAGDRQRPEAVGVSSTGKCCRFMLVVLCLEGLLVLFMWAYPSPIQPVSFQYSTDSCPELVGPLAVNDLLKRGERLFEDEIIGPEALVLDKEGYIYTGLGDGRIIRIDRDLKSFSTIIRTGIDSETCGKEAVERLCGRPLGMVFSSQNPDELIVTDSSFGLLKVNVKTKSMEVLVSANNSSVPVNFLNDLVELPNGSLLITDSSLKFSRQDNGLEGLECGANGQLLAYHPGDGSFQVVLRELHFPNGLSHTGDGQSVLLAETTRARILRYYFAGEREGTVEVFSENLPSWPDNMSPSSTGGFWVGTAITRSPVLNYFAGNMVSFRSFLAKFNLVPLLQWIGLLPEHAMVLELSREGKVIRSLHDKGGTLTSATSQILELGDTLLIGSYKAPYIIRVKL